MTTLIELNGSPLAIVSKELNESEHFWEFMDQWVSARDYDPENDLTTIERPQDFEEIYKETDTNVTTTRNKQGDTSEFGKGYAYCLGLFLAHAERITKLTQDYSKSEKNRAASMWFNGAADRLFELEIPRKIKEPRRSEILKWRNHCIDLRYCFNDKKCSLEDVEKAIQYAKNLLLEWDHSCGIEATKGDWE